MAADFGNPQLADVASRLQKLRREHPIRRLEVFGSVARGDATAASNLDLLVTLDESRDVTTDEVLEMAGEAEELVGRPLDFVIRQSVEQSSNTIAKNQTSIRQCAFMAPDQVGRLQDILQAATLIAS